MTTPRALMGNTWVEFSSAPGEIQGGIAAADNLTRKQFLDMLHIPFSATGGFETRLYGSNTPLTATNRKIQQGHYILTPYSPGADMCTSTKRYYPRTLSVSSRIRDKAFQDQIRRRDGRCVITGQINLEACVDRWIQWDTAHIFPLALDSIFQSQGYSKLITYNTPPGITSPQNGILLRKDIHALWDDYSIAVNPNDGYRIQSFTPGAWEYHGKILDSGCRQPGNPLSVVDGLLQWHYEQAVLCNMRGDGGSVIRIRLSAGDRYDGGD